MIYILWSSISVLCTIEHHNKWFTNSVKDSANWSQLILQEAKDPCLSMLPLPPKNTPVHFKTLKNNEQSWILLSEKFLLHFFKSYSVPLEWSNSCWKWQVTFENTYWLQLSSEIQLLNIRIFDSHISDRKKNNYLKDKIELLLFFLESFCSFRHFLWKSSANSAPSKHASEVGFARLLTRGTPTWSHLSEIEGTESTQLLCCSSGHIGKLDTCPSVLLGRFPALSRLCLD